ncbi:MAG: exopolyphosphatase [Euzebya sp.]
MTPPRDAPVAAVDIGTNSVRLLIAVGDGATQIHTLDRRLKITRLGQGVDASGALALSAVQRTADAVAEFATRWQAAGVQQTRVYSTSAARDATNALVLQQAISRACGVRLEILSGQQEAALAFRGATEGLSAQQSPFAVLDIGGGSTKVVVGTDRPLRSTSRQIGSVRLTERVLTSDPPTAAQIARARQVATTEADAAATAVGSLQEATLIGVAGTATTLAAVHTGVLTYVDGCVDRVEMTVQQVGAMATELLGSSASEIARIAAVQRGREDVLAAGALILDTMMQRLGCSQILIRESDGLDGMVLQMIRGPRG